MHVHKCAIHTHTHTETLMQASLLLGQDKITYQLKSSNPFFHLMKQAPHVSLNTESQCSVVPIYIFIALSPHRDFSPRGWPCLKHYFFLFCHSLSTMLPLAFSSCSFQYNKHHAWTDTLTLLYVAETTTHCIKKDYPN